MARESSVGGISPDYAGRMTKLSQQIRYKMSLPGARANVGPVYNITTSSNTQLSIRSFSIQYNSYSEKQRAYFLVAQDQNGAIFGHVQGEFTIPNEPIFYPLGKSEIDVYGSLVATAFRGIGASTPLILAHRDFLQREANILGRPVTLHVTNANIEVLVAARQMYINDPTYANLEILRDRIAQQDRWQSRLGKNPRDIPFRPKRGARRKPQPDIVTLGIPTDKSLVPVIVDEAFNAHPAKTLNGSNNPPELEQVLQAMEAIAT